MKLIMAQRYTDMGSGRDATCGTRVQIECLGCTRLLTNWFRHRLRMWSDFSDPCLNSVPCKYDTTKYQTLQSWSHRELVMSVTEAQIGGCLSMYSGEVNTVWLKRAGTWDCKLEVSQLLHICSKVVYCRTQLLNLLISPLPTGLFLSLCLPSKVSTG